MNEIYGKPENGQITEERQVGVYYRKKSLVVDGQKLTSPNTAEQFIAAGWLLRINPVFTDKQHVGVVAILSASSYTFEVIDKDAAELAHDFAVRLQMLSDAAAAYIDAAAHWTAGAMVWEKAKSKPKSSAIQGWVESIWGLYYEREAALEAGGEWSTDLLDFSILGPIPYKIKEALAE